MDDFVSYNELVEQGITPRFELSISNNPVKRPLARSIGRALLPKKVENWFLGSQEDEDFLNKYSDDDIPTYDEINENYKSGLYNKDDLINYSNLRTKYEHARADRDYTDVRNANIGQEATELISAGIGGGGATATKVGARLLRPLFGKKIALQTTQGLLGGGLGGAAHGFGTGLVQEDVNPFTQGLIEGGIGLGIGGGIGLGLGQIGKRLAYNNLFKNDGIGLGKILNGDETKFANYFDDYVSGLKGDPEFITDFSQLPAVGERTLFDNANTNLRLARQGLRPRATTAEGQYNFIGENAQKADKVALNNAQKLFNEGVDNESIRQQTGWFKGVDGKWRYEIPYGELYEHPELTEWSDIYNRGSKSYSVKLKDLYDSPELYKNYPELGEMSVYFDKMPNANGVTDYESIAINQDLLPIENPKYMEELNKIKNTDEYKKFNNIREKFNNNEISYDEFEPIEEAFNNSALGDRYNDLLWDDVKELPRYLQKGNEEKLRKTLIHEIQHNIQNKEGFAVGGDPSATEDYMKLAGEVEARLAARRSLMRKPEELTEFSPLTNGLGGYDVAPEQQIVKFDHNDSNLYDKLINNDDLTPDQLSAKLKAKAAEMRKQKTTYAKGENMSAGIMSQLMRNGSDIPPIDFAPKDVIIRKRAYKEIWLDNQKQISSSFVERLASKNKNTKYIKMPLSDGFTYYAHIKNGAPIFYKRVRTK